MLFFYFLAIVRKWEKWNNLWFLTHFSIFPFFPNNRKTEKWKNDISSHHFFIFFILLKKWKNRKMALISSNFPLFYFHMKNWKMKNWQKLINILSFIIFLNLNIPQKWNLFKNIFFYWALFKATILTAVL